MTCATLTKRHRPRVLALPDNVDYLDTDPGHSDETRFTLLSRRYRVLEMPLDNLQQRYALIFRGREPVAAVVAQLVTSHSRVGKARKHHRG